MIHHSPSMSVFEGPFFLPLADFRQPEAGKRTSTVVRSFVPKVRKLPVLGTQIEVGAGEENATTTTTKVDQFVVRDSEPAWYPEVIAKLNSFGTLVDGWKGHGSVAPTTTVLEEVIDLVAQFGNEVPVVPAPSTSVDEDGTIVLHWNYSGFSATVTAYGDGTYSFFAKSGSALSRSNSEPIGQPLPRDLANILMIGSFTA